MANHVILRNNLIIKYLRDPRLLLSANIDRMEIDHIMLEFHNVDSVLLN